MTVFREFWDVPNFRDAFTSLIKLPETAIGALADALDQGPLPYSPPEGSGISAEDWMRSRPTVATLVSIRDTEGFAELVKDIKRTFEGSPDRDRAEAVTRQLLELDPDREQLSFIRRTQDAGLPVLVSMSVEVDFRAVTSVTGGQPTLAPVYVVRLTFDEDIAGSNAIVFQVVAEDAADIVIERLREAKSLRAGIAGRLPADLLHSQIRQEILENASDQAGGTILNDD